MLILWINLNMSFLSTNGGHRCALINFIEASNRCETTLQKPVISNIYDNIYLVGWSEPQRCPPKAQLIHTLKKTGGQVSFSIIKPKVGSIKQPNDSYQLPAKRKRTATGNSYQSVPKPTLLLPG